MPPVIAAMLTLEKQVEGFMQLFTSATSRLCKEQQQKHRSQLPISLLGEEDMEDRQRARHTNPLSADDSPTGHSDISLATTATGTSGDHARCFWNGFQSSSLERQVCDLPLLVNVSTESVDSETPEAVSSESSSPRASVGNEQEKDD